jgi:hypothetical protein
LWVRFFRASKTFDDRGPFNVYSSLLLSKLFVAILRMLVSFGNIPTTFVLRFTALNTLSNMFVERILA